MITDKNAKSNRIWMIIRSFYPIVGGAERQAQTLSKQLIEQGWTVNVVTRRQNSQQKNLVLSREEKIDGIPVHRVFNSTMKVLSTILYVINGLILISKNRSESDFYYAHDIGSPAWMAIFARLLFGGLSIVKLRSSVKAYHLTWWRWLHLLLISRFIDRFVIVNQATVSMLEQLHIGAERIWPVPNGVDTNKFNPISLQKKMELRRNLGLPAKKVIALSVGRLVPDKTYNILIESCVQIPSTLLNDLQVVIVGDGPEKDSLQALAQIKGVTEKICFVGYQEQPLAYYQAADFFVLTSRGEGLSNALLEAMSCGLPVVSSMVDGSTDWVQPGINGYLFPPEDFAHLTEILIQMISYKSEWKGMSMSNRQLVVQKLSIPVIGKIFSDLLISSRS